jgi:serine-type D-Ala-D-Ala carboxypeptidase/endopeptidase
LDIVTTVLQGLPVAYAAIGAGSRLADGVNNRVLPPLRRRWHGNWRAGEGFEATVELFRRIQAPRAAIAAALVSPASCRFCCIGAHQGVAIDEGSRFEIGSLTKTFTAALLREMAHRGEVALDTPVSSMLPSSLRPSSEFPRSLRLEDLACHAGGLPRLPITPRMPLGILLRPCNPYAWLRPDTALRWLRHRRLHDVGLRYAYSNLGVGLLGAVLAHRLGTDLEPALRQRLLNPLMLHSTGFRSAGRTVVRPHTAAGLPMPAWDMQDLAGAGGLRASLADVARWVQAHLRPQPPLHSDVIEPRLRIDERRSVGLGWHLLHHVQGDIAWHNGATGGSRSFAAFNRNRGQGVVLLSNYSVPLDSLGLKLLGLMPPF